MLSNRQLSTVSTNFKRSVKEYIRMSWNMVAPFFINMWKYQHPPSGRTGDSTPWLFPLMTLILILPSLPSGYATGMLENQASEKKKEFSKHADNRHTPQGSVLDRSVPISNVMIKTRPSTPY